MLLMSHTTVLSVNIKTKILLQMTLLTIIAISMRHCMLCRVINQAILYV